MQKTIRRARVPSDDNGLGGVSCGSLASQSNGKPHRRRWPPGGQAYSECEACKMKPIKSCHCFMDFDKLSPGLNHPM
jgi:hypothetical protein